MILRPSRPYLFARPELEEQLDRTEWRVQVVLAVVACQAADYGYALKITSIERTFDQTRALYRAAGQPEPKFPGVHDVRPCRGIDATPVAFPMQSPRVAPDRIAPMLETFGNALFAFPRGKQAVLYHAVEGHHLHFQAPWDELGMRPWAGEAKL